MSGDRMLSASPATPRLSGRVEEAGIREFLAFMVGSECYALPLSCVREIMRVPPIAEVPRAPAEVLGIVSVRGQVTTLFDLRKKLDLPCAAIGQRTRVLLIDQGDEVLGLLCDRVLQVYRLSEDEVELASVLGGETSSYVMGIGRPGQRKTQGAGAARVASARAAAAQQSAAEILILLDPIALFKRHAHE
ncbi:MAG TPA: chemotaxis protein CheW [Polyangiales bacterium]